MEQRTMPFIVVATSDNTNAFGLYGMVVVNKSGDTFEVAANQLRVRRPGDVIRVPVEDDNTPIWGLMGYEIPRELPQMPSDLVEKAWGALDKPAYIAV